VKQPLTSAVQYNESKGELKLGPAPLEENLRAETERALQAQAQAGLDPDLSPQDLQLTRPSSVPGLVSPTSADLPPHPPTFRTMDVKREVELVRDARKRIKLQPNTPHLDKDANGTPGSFAQALPSICAYTLHDTGDG
jgi:transcription initiation factor TFIID subunit 5